jgi:hypothetical protein
MAFTHRVRLHFRSLSLTDVAFDQILKSAEDCYAPHGIRIEFASGMSLGLSDDEAKKFEQVDGSCKWTVTEGEFAELQKLGGTVPSNEILVYYISKFDTSLLGCGGHAPNRPACILASKASRWDTAHEVGHVLLTSAFSPVHHANEKNLMHATSVPATTPSLDAAQVAQIKRSPCCVKIG